MSSRQLARLLYRLDRSPLPLTDPVRLQLELELIALLAAGARDEAEPCRHVLVGLDEACEWAH